MANFSSASVSKLLKKSGLFASTRSANKIYSTETAGFQTQTIRTGRFSG